MWSLFIFVIYSFFWGGGGGSLLKRCLYFCRVQDQALLNSCALVCLIAWHTDPRITAVTWSTGTVQMKSVQSPRSDPEKPSPKTLFKGSFQTALVFIPLPFNHFIHVLCVFSLWSRGVGLRRNVTVSQPHPAQKEQRQADKGSRCECLWHFQTARLAATAVLTAIWQFHLFTATLQQETWWYGVGKHKNNLKFHISEMYQLMQTSLIYQSNRNGCDTSWATSDI